MVVGSKALIVKVVQLGLSVVVKKIVGDDVPEVNLKWGEFPSGK